MAQIELRARVPRRGIGPYAAVMYAAVIVASLPTWAFEVHLLMHVVGATMLIGNAIVMAVWLLRAAATESDNAKRRAARAVNAGDVWFTVPGVMLLLANGVAMAAERYGGLTGFWSTDWIVAGLLLLGTTGAVWALQLVPAQLRLRRLTQAPGRLDQRAFRATVQRWYGWGTVATLLPIAAAVLMTAKP